MKTLGQIAYAADANGEPWGDEWEEESALVRESYERMAQAVRATVIRESLAAALEPGIIQEADIRSLVLKCCGVGA